MKRKIMQSMFDGRNRSFPLPGFGPCRDRKKLKAVQEMEISQETEESEEVGAADLDSWNSEEELMVFGLSDLDLEEDGGCAWLLSMTGTDGSKYCELDAWKRSAGDEQYVFAESQQYVYGLVCILSGTSGGF